MSLSDHRFCLCCQDEFTGREIDIIGGTRAHGRLRLICPTPGCNSTSEDWIPVFGREELLRLVADGDFVRLTRKRLQNRQEDELSHRAATDHHGTLKKITRLFWPLRAASRA
jgi:hypothetical protein